MNTTCKEITLAKLSLLPSKLREELADSICKSFSDKHDVECGDCQVVKVISPFYISEDGICLSFRDENDVYVTRCFGINDILTYMTKDTSPGCIANLDDWKLMSYPEKIQAIIKYRCNCTPS